MRHTETRSRDAIPFSFRQTHMDTLQTCMRTGYPSKRDSEMLKTRLKKRVAFVPSLFPK